MPGYRHHGSPNRSHHAGSAVTRGRRWLWSIAEATGVISITALGAADGSTMRSFRAQSIGQVVPAPLWPGPYRVIGDERLLIFDSVDDAVQRCLDLHQPLPKKQAAPPHEAGSDESDTAEPTQHWTPTPQEPADADAIPAQDFTTSWGVDTLVHWSLTEAGLVTVTGYTTAHLRLIADIEAGSISISNLRILGRDPSGFPLPVAFTSRAEAGAYLAGTALTHALSTAERITEQGFQVAA